jgi:hypothetical protein
MIEISRKLVEYKFDFEKIKKETLSLLKKYNNVGQIGLTHTNRDIPADKRIFESCGHLRDLSSASVRFKETDFKVFNEEFKDTYFYEIYNTIPNIGRFRIMNMSGPSCYSIHTDVTYRYHIAIETSPDCLFLFPDLNKTLHIPLDGNFYIVNTKHRHTFINGSRSRRIHIVLDDLSSLSIPK